MSESDDQDSDELLNDLDRLAVEMRDEAKGVTHYLFDESAVAMREAAEELRRLRSEIGTLKAVLRQARSFALNAITARVRVEAFIGTDHPMIQTIDAVL